MGLSKQTFPRWSFDNVIVSSNLYTSTFHFPLLFLLNRTAAKLKNDYRTQTTLLFNNCYSTSQGLSQNFKKYLKI